MGFTKKKRMRKHLIYYKMAHNFHPPYHVLIDPESLRLAVEYKVSLETLLPNMLKEKTILVTTACLSNRMKSFNSPVIDRFIAEHLRKVEPCQHKLKEGEEVSTTSSKNVAPAACIKSLIGSGINRRRFFVLTQNDQLRSWLHKPAHASPALYFATNQINFEAPTFKDKKTSKEKSEKSSKYLNDSEFEKLREIKKAEKEARELLLKKRRKKQVKGPNPLSVLKSKKKKVPEQLQKGKLPEKQGVGKEKERKEGESGVKRKREDQAERTITTTTTEGEEQKKKRKNRRRGGGKKRKVEVESVE